MAAKKKAGQTALAVSDGGSRQYAGGWSGPKPSRAEVKAAGGAYRELYISPEWAAQLERLRVKLGLPTDRWLGALLRAATEALEEKVGAKNG